MNVRLCIIHVSMTVRLRYECQVMYYSCFYDCYVMNVRLCIINVSMSVVML